MQPARMQLLEQAKYDPEALSSLMNAYRPLILAAVRFHMHCVRDEYIDVAHDAFREAVGAYAPERGAFLPLCRRILAQRLIDERRRLRLDREISMADISPEAQCATEQAAAMDAYRVKSYEEERREQLLDYADALRALGMTLPQVQRACPRHEATRELCIRAIRFLVRDAALADRTRRGRLPIAALCEAFDTGDRIWERHRRYLIAALVALDGSYPAIEKYILSGRDRV